MAKKELETKEKQPVPATSRKDDVLTDGELDEIAGGTNPPRDAASGLATGKRMHKPITVTASF